MGGMPEQIAINSYELACAREELARSFGAIDAKRPTAWTQYGYPEQIGFSQYLQAYSRGGAGHGAVHRLLDKCWQSNARIKSPASDKETPWEVKVNKLLDSIQAWKKFKDFDRRNMVGRYAGLIYRVGDGKKLDQPLEKATRLVEIVPVYEDQLKITEWFSDQTAENFGQPKMFQYRMKSQAALATDMQGQPDQWVDVHPSRVQILAEGSAGDMFDGVPLLKAGFNDLVDLEKITGGSAESFLKNSARTLVFEYDKDASLAAISAANEDGAPGKTVRQVHSEQTRELNRNQDSSIVIQGGKANTLQTTISDPRGAFEVAACSFAASVQMPFTIIFGQQTGRLASDEDKADMAARCGSRQKGELTPMLKEFVTRMQAADIIEAGEFEIEWPAVDAPSDADKLANLDKATSAMQKAFQAGISEPIFDTNELRAMVGYEPRKDDGMPTEGDPAKDDPAAVVTE